jgi:hypothetical protein
VRTASEVVHHNCDQRESESYVIGFDHVRGRFPEFVCRPMAEHCHEAEGPRLEENSTELALWIGDQAVPNIGDPPHHCWRPRRAVFKCSASTSTRQRAMRPALRSCRAAWCWFVESGRLEPEASRGPPAAVRLKIPDNRSHVGYALAQCDGRMAAVKVRYGGFRICYDHWGTWVSCRLW